MQLKARLLIIAKHRLGFLLVAALIGFAILCWDAVGYVCDALFSAAPWQGTYTVEHAQ
jgi:hypothetical protein